jgi:hypothetical protein
MFLSPRSRCIDLCFDICGRDYHEAAGDVVEQLAQDTPADDSDANAIRSTASKGSCRNIAVTLKTPQRPLSPVCNNDQVFFSSRVIQTRNHRADNTTMEPIMVPPGARFPKAGRPSRPNAS